LRATGRGHLGGLARLLVEGGGWRDARHPLAKPLLLVEEIADVILGVLEVR
jgi:hypothetical protein